MTINCKTRKSNSTRDVEYTVFVPAYVILPWPWTLIFWLQNLIHSPLFRNLTYEVRVRVRTDWRTFAAVSLDFPEYNSLWTHWTSVVGGPNAADCVIGTLHGDRARLPKNSTGLATGPRAMFHSAQQYRGMTPWRERRYCLRCVWSVRHNKTKR